MELQEIKAGALGNAGDQVYTRQSLAPYFQQMERAAVIIVVVAQNQLDSLTYPEIVLNGLSEKIFSDARFVLAVNKCDEQPIAGFRDSNIVALARKLQCEDRVFRISGTTGAEGYDFALFRECVVHLIGDFYDRSLP
jgi:hypothetical protein